MEKHTIIRVHTGNVTGTITPYMTGACLEDANHEVYGGLYSQMIFGEGFEEEPLHINPAVGPAFDGLSGTVSCLAERDTSGMKRRSALGNPSGEGLQRVFSNERLVVPTGVVTAR